MPVAPIPKEQIERTQEWLRGELRLVGGVNEGNPLPANADLVAALKEGGLLYFRGRRFNVKHIGFVEGARLSVLETRYANLALKEKARSERKAEGLPVEMSVDEIKEMLDVLEDTVAMFHDFVEPVGLIERLLWRWLRNPFENATEKEIGELMGFFFVCRTRSSVGFGSRRRPARHRGSTTLVTS